MTRADHRAFAVRFFEALDSWASPLARAAAERLFCYKYQGQTLIRVEYIEFWQSFAGAFSL